MSIPVALPDLEQTLTRYRFAYLLSSSQGAPRVVAIHPIFENGSFTISGLGRRSLENIGARPQVALVWPPTATGEHTLIADGTASVEGNDIRVKPSHAVLHRPAPATDGS